MLLRVRTGPGGLPRGRPRVLAARDARAPAPASRRAVREPLRIEGAHNLVLLRGRPGRRDRLGRLARSRGARPGRAPAGREPRSRRRAAGHARCCRGGRRRPRSARRTSYSWAPIREVAILFAGIFVTIIPALAMLRVGEHGGTGGRGARRFATPVHFFWASGALSSFLDNAPTYLAFLNTALGRLFPGVAGARRRRAA